MDVQQTPFQKLRARSVLGRLILANILGVVVIVFALGKNFDLRSPRVLGLFLLVPDLIFLIWIAWRMRRVGLSPGLIVGVLPGWTEFKRYGGLALLVVGVSWASVYIFYFPLSYLAPKVVEMMLLSQTSQSFFVLHEPGYVWTDVLSFLGVVICAPIAEEFIFRGLLLTRWSLKWGVPRAIFVTSLIFGLLHADILGHFFFAYVMAVVYIETKSLLLPICLHAANNAIAWFMEAGYVLWGTAGNDSDNSIAAFQSGWKSGLVVAMVIVPLAIWFVRRHYPSLQWKVPFVVFEEEKRELMPLEETL